MDCCPTICPSAAASALYEASSKPNDLAREAVGCTGVLGRVAGFNNNVVIILMYGGVNF